jgi:hypothetical protein
MTAGFASQGPLAGEVDRTAFDPQDLSSYQGLGRLPAGGPQDAPEGRAGDSHPLGGLILVEALEVRESDRLHLVQGHDHLFEFTVRQTDRQEGRGGRFTGDQATTRRA